jgi:hypothetical protein
MMNGREKRLEKRNKQTKREGIQVAIAPFTWCFGQLPITSLLEEECTVNGFPPAFPHQSESQTFVLEHS